MAGEAWLGWLRFIAVLQGMFWSVWAGEAGQGKVVLGAARCGEVSYGWRG